MRPALTSARKSSSPTSWIAATRTCSGFSGEHRVIAYSTCIRSWMNFCQHSHEAAREWPCGGETQIVFRCWWWASPHSGPYPERVGAIARSRLYHSSEMRTNPGIGRAQNTQYAAAATSLPQHNRPIKDVPREAAGSSCVCRVIGTYTDASCSRATTAPIFLKPQLDPRNTVRAHQRWVGSLDSSSPSIFFQCSCMYPRVMSSSSRLALGSRPSYRRARSVEHHNRF
eukprot:scaffold1054_cov366-Prasinococcus_capsulatus_cf.AAC.21